VPDAPKRRLLYTALVAGVMTLATVLRFWTIGRGLPYSVGADEPDIMNRVLHMLHEGDFNPHEFFDYPTLTFYMQMVVAGARFIAGAVRGEWITLDQIWPGDFYLWARTFTALLSVGTVYITYRAARRWTPLTAIIAALALSVQPQLVREAHFALTDTPLTFFVSLTMLLSLYACEKGRLRWFILAGVGAGLAAATKYNGGTALLMPLAACLRVGELRVRTLAVVGVIIGAASAFVAGAPYSLINLPGFLNGFAALIQHYNQERAPTDPAYIVYLKHIADWFSVITTNGRLYRMTSYPALALCGLGAASLAIDAFRPSRLPNRSSCWCFRSSTSGSSRATRSSSRGTPCPSFRRCASRSAVGWTSSGAGCLDGCPMSATARSPWPRCCSRWRQRPGKRSASIWIVGKKTPPRSSRPGSSVTSNPVRP
jgi:4-amino-4-deoxy-L-arabinose transferase-like glycosyltransferase